MEARGILNCLQQIASFDPDLIKIINNLNEKNNCGIGTQVPDFLDNLEKTTSLMFN